MTEINIPDPVFQIDVHVHNIFSRDFESLGLRWDDNANVDDVGAYQVLVTVGGVTVFEVWYHDDHPRAREGHTLYIAQRAGAMGYCGSEEEAKAAALAEFGAEFVRLRESLRSLEDSVNDLLRWRDVR